VSSSCAAARSGEVLRLSRRQCPRCIVIRLGRKRKTGRLSGCWVYGWEGIDEENERAGLRGGSCNHHVRSFLSLRTFLLPGLGTFAAPTRFRLKVLSRVSVPTNESYQSTTKISHFFTGCGLNRCSFLFHRFASLLCVLPYPRILFAF
jgi:hypothetical protein